MDEGKARQQSARGARAKAERDSKLIDEFLTKAKEACHREWENSEPREAEARELIWMRLQALVDVEKCYARLIQDGKFAESELLKLKEDQDG